jgi:hypothetical protein
VTFFVVLTNIRYDWAGSKLMDIFYETVTPVH